MYKTKTITTIIIFFFLFAFESQAQRLNVFSAEPGKKGRPYADSKCYFGFIDSTRKVSDTVNSKNFYYLYFYLPQETAEIGIRLMSPVSSVIFPDKGDIVEEGYYDYIKTSKAWFDPWIAIEHQVVNNDSLNNDSAKAQWVMLGSNDDNDELFVQPSGKKTNALLRVVSDTTQLYKKIIPGFYRIVISCMKEEKFSGSYILQIGYATKLRGIKISRTLSEINIQ